MRSLTATVVPCVKQYANCNAIYFGTSVTIGNITSCLFFVFKSKMQLKCRNKEENIQGKGIRGENIPELSMWNHYKAVLKLLTLSDLIALIV